MQQWYQCPRCGAPVAFGVGFCGNCRTPLNWPTQQQPPPSYQQRQDTYQGYEQQAPERKRANPLLIASVALLATLILVGGGLLAVHGFSGRQSPAPAPAPTPAPAPAPAPAPSPNQPPEENKTPALTNMLLQAEELQAGWIKEDTKSSPSGIDISTVMYPDMKILGGATVTLINNGQQTKIVNNITLFGDKKSLLNNIEVNDDIFKYDLDDTVEAIKLGDGGVSRIERSSGGTPHVVDGKPVFPPVIRHGCLLYFSKGTYFVQLNYYCATLTTLSDEDISDFTYNLARKVETRIPTTNPPTQQVGESYQYDDYYPIILSLSDDKGNVIKTSLNNHYSGSYGSAITGTNLKIGDRIAWTIEAKDPKGRELYYRWNSNSQHFDDLLGYKWSTSNHIEYEITAGDLQTAGEDFRIVGEIKSEKEYLRSPGSEHDDAAFLDYKFLP